MAAPADDAPRLVYADWLLEHGNARGELIQVQCRLAKRLGDARALAKREQQLLHVHEHAWLAPLRPFIRSWKWRRGFLERASVDWEQPADALQTLALVPLERLQLLGSVPTLGRAAPHPTVEHFDCSHAGLRRDELRVLDTAFFAKARVLDLTGNGDAEVAELARCRLPALERLNLEHCRVTDEALTALAAAPFFPQLTHLHLGADAPLRSLAPLAAAKALKWLQAPFTRETVLELLGQRRKRFAVRYVAHDDDVTRSLRTHFGEPATAWAQLG